MFYQILFSPQAKRCAIITYEKSVSHPRRSSPPPPKPGLVPNTPRMTAPGNPFPTLTRRPKPNYPDTFGNPNAFHTALTQN